MGTVGEDFADYRAWLESHGVDCRAVKVITGEHTASCFINTDLQDNQITAFYPGAMAQAASLSLAEAGVTPRRLGRHRSERPRGDEPLHCRVYRTEDSRIFTTRRCSCLAWSAPSWRRAAAAPDPGGQRL